MSLSQNPLDLFSHFFTPDVIAGIVRETNRYAAQCLQQSDTIWETDVEEMRAYLGFYILMGMVREPEIRDYWSRDELLHYSPIARRISRARFEEISRYFHLVDNTALLARGTPGYHRLQKVKPIVDTVKGNFSAVYQPGVNLSVDEAMVPFKGKFCKRQ